jgi:hypothetical protein
VEQDAERCLVSKSRWRCMSEVEATAASGSLFGQVPLPIGSEAKRKADQQDVRWQRTRFVAALLLTDALLGGLAFAGAIAICTQALPPAMVLAGSLGAQIPLMLAALVALYALLGLYSMRTETLLARFRCRATAALIFGLVGMLLWARGGSASEAGSFAFGGAVAGSGLVGRRASETGVRPMDDGTRGERSAPEAW